MSAIQPVFGSYIQVTNNTHSFTGSSRHDVFIQTYLKPTWLPKLLGLSEQNSHTIYHTQL